MELALYILGGLILVHILFQWGRIRYYGSITDRLVSSATRVEHHPDSSTRRILIIGDSLWAGVGAGNPEDSLAGRLIADLPEAEVENKAISGARIADGLDQLDVALSEPGEYDQIIIQLGANDILNFSSLKQARKDLRQLLEQAQAAAPDVAYMVSGSVGFAPVFLRPLDWLYTFQSRRYLAVFGAVAEKAGVEYIDLYRARKFDPFYKNPEKFYAADKFHPSGAGYGLWYGKCKGQLQCFTYDPEQTISNTVPE